MKNTLLKKYIIITKNRLFSLACVLFLIVVGTVYINFNGINSIATSTSQVTNWGLSFQTEGFPPVGNANSNFLSEYNSFYVGDTSQKQIYLTFDAGYENGHTDSILTTLENQGIKATFFLVGNYLEKEETLVKRMAEEGHYVANHTYNHPDMSAITDKESFIEELTLVEEKYKEITGEDMIKLYRPPQGKYCVDNLELAEELGYYTVFWSLAYVDWYEEDQPTKDEAFSKLIPRIHNGAIVLLHSTSATNAEILDELLTEWKNMGYSFGDITDLMN